MTCLFAVAAQHAPLQRIPIQLHDGEVTVPPDRRVVVKQGQTLAIEWRSDVAGEIHLHGYDVTVALPANDVVVTRFQANATGRFPVTSHGFGERAGKTHGHGALLYLEVHPD